MINKMICEFCGKVSDKKMAVWLNHELQEEYKICEVCVSKVKSGTFKE